MHEQDGPEPTVHYPPLVRALGAAIFAGGVLVLWFWVWVPVRLAWHGILADFPHRLLIATPLFIYCGLMILRDRPDPGTERFIRAIVVAMLCGFLLSVGTLYAIDWAWTNGAATGNRG